MGPNASPLARFLRKKGSKPSPEAESEDFLIHSKLSFKHRKALEERFEEHRGEDGKFFQELRPRILVKPTGVIGTRINLVQASKVVIMEPDYLL